ncbi:steroid receptor RNA activator 1 isoform X2 [Denticeps clupeoides]|uniref:Steroid receptor RNA activator 1 n=1 Tax=Denticeps clupeoides TaxID=299321 RepID=A0AAY4BAL9_9TELE|nr:steroid receptor RNA activator 1 isoform X2 [Denticeps clupeoides]
MDELYVKPGNVERGWNDPPQFSYGLQTAQGGPKRTLLNKRVAHPQVSGAHSPSPGPPRPTPHAVHSTPPTNPAPPPRPCGTPGPPPAGMATPPQPAAVLQSAGPPEGQSEVAPGLDDVVALFNWALVACRQSVKKHICDDMEKRIRLFEEMWRSGKLSLPVRRRMNMLVQEMKNRNWDASDEIHRALMVDHVNEVSQWMVGVKRLITETRNLPPELLSAEEGAKIESNNSSLPVPE